MTTEDCPNADYFDPEEYPLGFDENCFPIDPCIPGGYTLNHLLPCEYVPEPTEEPTEEPIIETVVAVVEPPIPQQMLPETGLSMFWVGWVLIAFAAIAGGIGLWRWANDVGEED